MGTDVMWAMILLFGMLVLFILGVPISWSIGGVAIFVSLYLWGSVSMGIIVGQVYGGLMKVSFTALPLFVFMGVLLEKSGLADDLFGMLYAWSGKMRGGLAVTSVVVCMVFAAMSGLTAAACVTMGLIALPAMRNRGYSKDLALGSVVAPSTVGILIPPSVYMIIIGVIGRVSVGKLFIGGLIPGVLMSILFIIYILFVAWRKPESCPATTEEVSWAVKLTQLRHLVLPMIIIVSVLGTIMAGIATPTEAASLGCITLILSVIIRGRLTKKLIMETSLETYKLTAFNMWLILISVAFSSVFIKVGGIEIMQNLLVSEGMSRWVSFSLTMGIIFIMGMFLDPFAIVMIIGPILFPIMAALGFDLVWVGVLFVVMLCTSYITPPFGANIFMLQAVVPEDIRTEDIYHSIWPFLGVMLVTLMIIVLVPDIVLWLPNMLLG